MKCILDRAKKARARQSGSGMIEAYMRCCGIQSEQKRPRARQSGSGTIETYMRYVD
jgi:hypothetical protein